MTESNNETTETLTFDSAMEELDHILSELESNSVGIDILSKKVSRGTFLIAFCKDQLAKITKEVDSAVSDLTNQED